MGCKDVFPSIPLLLEIRPCPSAPHTLVTIDVDELLVVRHLTDCMRLHVLVAVLLGILRFVNGTAASQEFYYLCNVISHCPCAATSLVPLHYPQPRKGREINAGLRPR